MNQRFEQPLDMRVLNLSNLDLPFDHVLNVKSGPVAAMVSEIRKYADLPYVFIVSKEKASLVPDLLSALKTIRSPCYPYAVMTLDGAGLDLDQPDMDIVSIGNADAPKIRERVVEYASRRLGFETGRLKFANPKALPEQVDVAIVGGGVTGLYAANRLRKAGISFCVLDKSDMIGGIWTKFANSASQVNSSECAYRLFEKSARSNRDHSYTREILEDISTLADNVSDNLFLGAEAEKIEKDNGRYQIRLNRSGEISVLKSKGIILAINDRVGTPNEIEWQNQAEFQGKIVSGISDGTKGLDWCGKNIVIVGMGAFAIENARTALEAGARHVTVVCRRHGTVCPKVIDYLNFVTPYDDAYRHDNKSNIRNMMYWKKLYQLSGATQPECWMAKVKHPGHTISVSDIWFIGHYLKKIATLNGEITGMTATGVIVDGQNEIEADVVVNCIGFERNAPQVKALSGYHEMYNNNYVDKDFMYLADAYIDDDAFNSLFGSSVLEMVKFYLEVFIKFFNNPEYEEMLAIEGTAIIPINERKWTHYIKAAMALIGRYADIRELADSQVARRTDNFLEIHDIETYLEENKREWLDTHSMLAGKRMKAEDCLPYVFDRLKPK